MHLPRDTLDSRTVYVVACTLSMCHCVSGFTSHGWATLPNVHGVLVHFVAWK